MTNTSHNYRSLYLGGTTTTMSLGLLLTWDACYPSSASQSHFPSARMLQQYGATCHNYNMAAVGAISLNVACLLTIETLYGFTVLFCVVSVANCAVNSWI